MVTVGAAAIGPGLLAPVQLPEQAKSSSRTVGLSEWRQLTGRISFPKSVAPLLLVVSRYSFPSQGLLPLSVTFPAYTTSARKSRFVSTEIRSPMKELSWLDLNGVTKLLLKPGPILRSTAKTLPSWP